MGLPEIKIPKMDKKFFKELFYSLFDEYSIKLLTLVAIAFSFRYFDTEEASVVAAVRTVFFGISAVVGGLLALIYLRVQSLRDGEKVIIIKEHELTVKHPFSFITNPGKQSNKPVNVSIKQHDQIMFSNLAASCGVWIGLFIWGHVSFGFVQPLAHQAALTFIGLLNTNLFHVYVLGKSPEKTKGMGRPWSASQMDSFAELWRAVKKEFQESMTLAEGSKKGKKNPLRRRQAK